MYLLIIIVIFSLSFILFTRHFKKFRKKDDTLFNYFLTIFATFIGAFLALSLTIHQNSRENVGKFVKLLEASKIDSKSVISRTNDALKVFNNDSKVESCCADYFKNNPIPKPELFISLFQNELVLEIISKESLVALLAEKKNLILLNNAINGKEWSNFDFINRLNWYKIHLALVNEILESEKLYAQNKISIKQLAEYIHRAIVKMTERSGQFSINRRIKIDKEMNRTN